MSRTKNILRNSKFNLIKFVLQLILQFILQTVLNLTLGRAYVGLGGLFSSVLLMLNLAELGIGSAIIFSMYKPIEDNDTEKIRALNNLYKKIYMIIASIVFVVGICILPFLRFFIKGEIPADINIYIVYIVLLLNTVIGYFAAHKRSLLFAYQRNDVESKAHTICLISMNFLQIVLLLLFRNYYLFICFMPFFTILECLIVVKAANKLFPLINGPAPKIDKETKKNITKNVAAISLHKVGEVVVGSTDNILISSIFGLGILGIYSNYFLIISAIISLLSIILTSTSGSIGNLIVTSTTEYSHKRFNELNFGYSWIVGFCSISLICLFQPFVTLWAKFTNGNIKLLPIYIVLFIVISFYLTANRQIVSSFKNAAGLMWHDRWKPIVEGLVNLVASIIFAKYLGLAGIFLGTILSTLIAPFWVEPFVLYKHYFKKSVWIYFGKYIFYTTITVISCAITYFLCWLLPVAGIGWFILKCFICLIVPNLIFLLCYFRTSEFRFLFDFFKNFIKMIKNKSKFE